MLNKALLLRKALFQSLLQAMPVRRILHSFESKQINTT
jgi:hypothetical protein